MWVGGVPTYTTYLEIRHVVAPIGPHLELQPLVIFKFQGPWEFNLDGAVARALDAFEVSFKEGEQRNEFVECKRGEVIRAHHVCNSAYLGSADGRSIDR